MLRLPWIRVAATAAAVLLLYSPQLLAKSLEPDPVPAAWLRAHADSANGGFANVMTAPAARALLTQPLGNIAYGAGPVIGPDGTVYIGNRQGMLFAFRADGSKAWSRQLPPGQEILASPAVGADGSIYVIGVSLFTDNRVNPPFTRPDSMLHKFLPGGGYAWNVPFPERGAPISNGHGGTSAPPNIWSFGGAEVVMVPVSYPNRVALGREVRLVAFSTDGPGVLAETPVTYFGQTVSGDCSPGLLLCLFPGMDFEGHGSDTSNPADRLPADARNPMPGVAISMSPGARTPWIIVSDQANDIVGFSFSPQGGFVEEFRLHDTATRLIAPPLALADTKTFVGAQQGVVVFRGKDVTHRSLIKGMGGPYLTRLVDGQTLIATGYSGFGEFRGNEVVHSEMLPGQSIVAAAASRSHVFISTASAFYTYDTVTMTQLAKLDWRGGGVSPPAIGPRGDVYAVANNMLHVFPRPCDGCAQDPFSATTPLAPASATAIPEPRQPIVPPPAPTQPTQGSSHFKKPVGPTGLRLHACTMLDGNECGRPVADAFCRAQGWAESDKYDVDNKKEHAETLAGEVCTKNKCKVFDYIDCEN